MSKKRKKVEVSDTTTVSPHPLNNHKFHFTFLNAYQAEAWNMIERNDITFILGPAGCGKTQIATAYAAKAILDKKARKIILCRPTVTTEALGYLPGTADDKLHPFLIPILDCLDECAGKQGQDRTRINEVLEFAPLAFMRGRSFNWSIGLLDEAQNSTMEQLKLFLTRIGKKSKLVISGDPHQSDLRTSGLMHIVDRLKDIEGVGICRLPEAAQVRHPVINKILEKI